uniref:Uncharacterized protein LOC117351126 isoform X2 n=1 Tax=Geotrypetes seraphini TaxID=260995 RepID=A0A6P8NZ58_GEOSA|nr:uncharacterized protein LOC117351126 isoform X2 [Geotrypetes seraphini]
METGIWKSNREENHALMQTLAKHACWHLDNGPFFEEERRKETPDLPEFADGSTKNGILHSSIMPGRQVGGRQIKRYNRFLRNLEGRRLPRFQLSSSFSTCLVNLRSSHPIKPKSRSSFVHKSSSHLNSRENLDSAGDPSAGVSRPSLSPEQRLVPPQTGSDLLQGTAGVSMPREGSLDLSLGGTPPLDSNENGVDESDQRFPCNIEEVRSASGGNSINFGILKKPNKN